MSARANYIVTMEPGTNTKSVRYLTHYVLGMPVFGPDEAQAKRMTKREAVAIARQRTRPGQRFGWQEALP